MNTDTPGESNIASATPSNTTVTLATPDPVHLQLVSPEPHNPPRFIFYPISWDGSEDPVTQSKKTTPSDVHTDYGHPNSPSAVFYSADTFWSIDRWRRDVVKSGDATVDLLDPIHDTEILSLLSFPQDDPGSSRNMSEKPSYRTDRSGSEDDVQLRCAHICDRESNYIMSS